MALLFATLMLASSVEAAAAPDAEIVVIAQKLKDWRGNWRMRKGAFTCTTTKSTGDLEIDAIGCSAITVCMTPALPQFQEIADAKLPKVIRNERMTALAQSLVPCLETNRSAGIAALADRRAGV